MHTTMPAPRKTSHARPGTRGSTDLPRVTVVLSGVDDLAPADAPVDLIDAWLAAPVGGLPLHHRLLETLHGLDVREVRVSGRRVAHRLVALCEREPALGLDVVLDDGRLWCPRDEAVLRLPAGGLPRVDTRALLRRAVRDGAATGRLLATRGTVSATARIGGAQWTPPPSRAIEGRLWDTSTPESLRRTARAALLGDIRELDVAGELVGDVLVGARAHVDPFVRVGGPSAIGDGSHASARVQLGYGAVVGRRVYLHEGAVIDDAVVLDDTDVRPGDVVRHEVRFGGLSLA